ncbi:O-antigen ligase family protein [Dactylosporangium sp. NPDC049525]|uniref:O-antigen ligase family protein n=1 Tax=Dactylosporangium sp. NPDC049525 TaxID=3154730 RepID=UPI00342F6E34
MTRRTATTAGVVAAVILAVLAAVLEHGRTGSLSESAEAFAGALIALGVVGLAVSLRGSTLQGAVLGGLFTLAGILTWTSTQRPIVIWAVLGVEVVVFAVWGRPWLRNLRELPALGGAWLGLSYWVFGVLGALFVLRSGHLTVAAQRLAYLGVFTLAVLAVVAVTSKDRRRDLSIGMAAAILVGIGALLYFGAGSLFDELHAIPDSASARVMRNRFWGGTGVFYHPNSLAGLVVIASVRVGFDRAFAAWQRLGVAVIAALVISISDSRTGFVFAAAAACAHAVVVFLRRRGEDEERGRARWVAVAMPFVVLAAIFTIGGGSTFLFRDRFTDGGSDVTSGRTDTWRQVWVDWEHAGWAEKTFGDARTSRAVVHRDNDGAPKEGPRRDLNTDNAAVGAFRRGGVLGAIGFLIGVALLLWHALRGLWYAVILRRPHVAQPALWFTVGAAAAVPTIMTEDWVIGGTNGAIWLVLLAGEVRSRQRAEPSAVVPGQSPATEPATGRQDATA